MAEKLFPHRKRCKACGKGLGSSAGDPVYDGLYCAPACAGIAIPASDVAHAPRECRTQRDSGWAFKRKYRSEEEIPDKIRQDPSTSWYWCSHCHHLHIGHSRMGEAEKFRMVRDPGEISDVLIKRRGQASIKDVAKAAGVRPIRLKELEEGAKHEENLETLFKVAKVLRLSLGFGIKSL